LRKNLIINKDVIEGLKGIPDESIQCCVTSPPYWGLRDYGVDGQLGLEPTLEEYIAKMVEVFQEVKRVLRKDGTCWVNLGDAYAGGGRGGNPAESKHRKQAPNVGSLISPSKIPANLKAKDMIGTPWRIAFALQQPQYTGDIKDIKDRVWLAAAIDGEGCMFIHKRKKGQSNGQGYVRKNASYGAGLEVANTNKAFVEKCMEITGKGSICHQDLGRRQRIYRWNLRSNECRKVIEQIYPHLVIKQHEARLLIGCPSSGEKAHEAHQSVIALHNGGEATIDFDPPNSMYEPGWYLRSDIIWSKSNPMPESVTDRPTKSHEYIFLLTKSARYYYDAEAIKTAPAESTINDKRGNDDGTRSDRNYPGSPSNGGTNLGGPIRGSAGGFRPNSGRRQKWPGIGPQHGAQRDRGEKYEPMATHQRVNRRTVWNIPAQAYPEAHFATFPEMIPKLCILAGSKRGDTILDPFLGSGTTGMVAQNEGREWIGIELNPEYAEMARKRTKIIQTSMNF